LQASKAGDFFINLATSMFGWMRGGPAKAAVIGSALMGTIRGSAVANVMTVGTFTIPLMKKTGYKNEVAGAIEAVGSTGGQIMPPVMGAAAFIMADYLKMPYVQVAIAAAIPACLYYLALFFMVDLEAAKNKLKGLPKEDLPNWRRILLREFFLLIPIVVLIYFLDIARYSPQKSAFYTILVLIIITYFRIETRMNVKKIATALIKGTLGG
jgi:TRAP transporter 4TM/12TM fusion protein